MQLVSATLLWLGASARSLPPPKEMMKVLITGEPGNTTCPGRLRSYCCYSLDFSDMQVECIGKHTSRAVAPEERAEKGSTAPDEETNHSVDTGCSGPGRVENLEKCLDYDPRPMCCCALDPDAWKPDEPDVCIPSRIGRALLKPN